MAKPRKRWATQPPLMKIGRQTHPSQAAAYRQVQTWAIKYRAGDLNPRITEIEVWVDERTGRGWELFEKVDLGEVAAGLKDG